MTLAIHSQFDSGSIQVLSLDDANDIQLALRPDHAADILQWFHFRLDGAAHSACRMRIVNVTEAAFPGGWEDYRAVASYDRQNWFRVPTQFDGEQLIITHTPEADVVYYAYFEPYTQERHLSLLGEAACHPLVRMESLVSTVQGRSLDLLTFGKPAMHKRKVWIIARQHPGESMAEWFVEGLVKRLLDEFDPVARECLAQAVFYIVPNMNPDGSYLGNLRTNAAGVNLNRAWMEPSMITSPEVFAVREHIKTTGCDLFLDIHGDETIPYVFAAGCEMLPSFNHEQAAAQSRFTKDFVFACPDFQTRFGYEPSRYSADALTLASKYIGHTYGCLSLTLELPFKDNANAPDVRYGWNGARSMRLGAAVLLPILRSL